MNPRFLLRSFHNFSVEVVSHTTWRLSLRGGRPLFERFMFVNGDGNYQIYIECTLYILKEHQGAMYSSLSLRIAMIQYDDRIQSERTYLYYRKWRRYSARPQCSLVACGPFTGNKSLPQKIVNNRDCVIQSWLSAYVVRDFIAPAGFWPRGQNPRRH